MDPTRWLVRFDPQASRAGLSVRGAANVDGPSLESIVTALTDHGPEPPGSAGRDGAASCGRDRRGPTLVPCGGTTHGLSRYPTDHLGRTVTHLVLSVVTI